MVFLYKGSCFTSNTGEETAFCLLEKVDGLIMLLRRVSIHRGQLSQSLPAQFPDITAQLATLAERNKGEIRHKLEESDVDNRNNDVLPSANIPLSTSQRSLEILDFSLTQENMILSSKQNP